MRKESPEAERIIESAEAEIFDGKLGDIAEVTYAYTKIGSEKYFNRTIFSHFAGVKPEEGMEKAFNEAGRKLVEKRSDIARHLERIESLPKTAVSERIEILKGSLSYLDTILEITQIGLPFEAEKGGRPHAMGESEVNSAIAKMEALERTIFGESLREVPEEKAYALRRLAREYENGAWRLENGEKETFRKLFQKLWGDKLPRPSSRQGRRKRYEDWKMSEDPNDAPVSRNAYVEIFRRAFSAYRIDKPVVVEERSSIYDGEDALRIPNSEEYAIRRFSRVLGLLQHEIGTHYLIAENNRQVLWGFRGGRNLEREEGIASIAEGLVNGVGLREFAKTRANPGVYAGEILTGEELRTLIRLQYRMSGNSHADEVSLLLRRKRNYPMGYRWAQHKDANYARGEKKVAEYLLNGGDLRKLFVAKVALEDMETAWNVARREKIDIRLPLLIEELVKRSIEKKSFSKREIDRMALDAYPFLKEVLSADSPKEFPVPQKVEAILNGGNPSG